MVRENPEEKVVLFSDRARSEFSASSEAGKIFNRELRSKVSRLKLVAPDGDYPCAADDALHNARSALSWHSRRWKIRSYESELFDLADMLGVVTSDDARRRMMPLIDTAMAQHRLWCQSKADPRCGQSKVSQHGAMYAHIVCVFLVLGALERIACGEPARWESVDTGLRPASEDRKPCPVASVRAITSHWLRIDPGRINDE